MSVEDEDGIIRVDFGKSGTTLDVKIGDMPCSHRKVVVAEFSRRVECSGCGASLDPLTVLLSYAKRERRFQATTSARNALVKQIVELKNEERRIKQRVSKARRKADRQLSLL